MYHVCCIQYMYIACILHTEVCALYEDCVVCAVCIYLILSSYCVYCMVVALKALSAYCRVCCVHYIVCTALYVSSMLQVCIDIKFLLHPYSDLSPPLI